MSHLPVAPEVQPRLRALWPRDPEAAELLASCVARRPAFREHREVYGAAADRSFRFTGKRVARLRAIRGRYMTSALAEADRSGNYDRFKAECLSVDEAIEAAVAASAVRRIDPSICIAEQIGRDRRAA